MIAIDRIDHFVITVADVGATCDFYSRVLGMEVVTFGAEKRKALSCGRNKINLHQSGQEFEPKAHRVMPGSADFCLITETPLADVISHLKDCGVALVQGPVPKSGATGQLQSVYFRDPDGNLVEVSNYV